MNKLISFLIFISLTLVSFHSHAQYTGPSNVPQVLTVEEVKSNAPKLDRTDAIVQVKGFVTKQINNEDFEFKDQSGTIRIEIDKKILNTIQFDENTEIIIFGEVDYNLLEGSEIEVERIELVMPKESNGQE